jgi:Protein of unknown function (DUF4232)
VGRVVAIVALVALALVTEGAQGSPRPIRGCDPADLTATFVEVPGSAGGGLVAYRLTLRNRSKTACRLRFAGVRLLDRHGKGLLTSIAPDPSDALGSTVVLEPGQAGVQTAHFSGTYPGQGEPASGPCEPPAYWLRIVYRRAPKQVLAKVQPPTPVCSNGMLMLGAVGPAH